MPAKGSPPAVDCAGDDIAAFPRRIELSAFTAWANNVLEDASFKPARPASAQVVILPLSQLLARPFGTIVLPSTDEVHLPMSPEPPNA